MPSAVDIITYIGIPLAVLGVMPVLYTCFSALITKTRVQRTVRQSHLSLTTRVGLLAGMVEVDLPRYQLHTLPRAAPEYWKECDKRSEMRGGTWSILNWQKIAIGKVTYRIQHSDELRQPQAEVDMGNLVTFLLDRGATPSAHGLQLLRLMGLQTPPGTPILLADGDASKPVLVISTPDESEGRLSLKLLWYDEMTPGNGRSLDSLPPYWIRLVSTTRLSQSDEQPSEKAYPPVRLYLGVEGLEDARHDSLFASDELKEGTISHLLPDPRTPDAPVPLWFACSIVSICSHAPDQATGLFRFNIPARIQSFARRDTIPHGVLVLLNMRSEEESPLFKEKRALMEEAARERRITELREQGALMMRMQKMSQQERIKTQMEEAQNKMRKMATDRAERAMEELENKASALSSPRVGCKVVAEAALYWLRNTKKVPEDTELKDLATAIVHAMIFDPSLADGVCGVLASWIGWMDLLMTDQHYEYFKNNQTWFCYAAVLLHQIAEHEFNVRVHPVAKDLDDCQRVWGKVYLG